MQCSGIHSFLEAMNSLRNSKKLWYMYNIMCICRGQIIVLCTYYCYPSFALLGSFDVQNVSTTLEGDTLTVECWFIEGSRAKGCLVLITSSTGSSEGGPPFYQVIERGEERLVAEEQVRGLPAGGGGRFSVLVFDVEETGAPAPLPAAVEGLYLEMTAVKSAGKVYVWV